MLEIAKECIDRLQQRIRSAGDKSRLVASTLLEERGEGDNMTFLELLEGRGEGGTMTFLENYLEILINIANAQAEDSWKGLLHFLDNHDTWPREQFWDSFNEKLVELGNTSAAYREKCFYRTEDNYNIFHLVCKHNPPLEIVQTLIDVIPLKGGRYPNHYNHLSRGLDRGLGTREYPLWTAIRHGASFDLVRFLVEADKTKEKKTLKPFRCFDIFDKEDVLLHLLVINRAKYTSEVFSAILFYLVPNLGKDNLQLIREGSTDETPVAVLFNSLKDEGRTIEEILQNDDFVFLLRATCYHQNCLRWTKQKMSTDFHGRRSDIDLISVPHAFFVCSACFKEKYTTAVLQHLASQDKSFLIDKDMHGVHPIHGVLDRRDYFVDTSCFCDFQAYILTMMLRLAPACARQRNEKGLYPLHRVADRNRYSFFRDSGERRLQLVQLVFEADPDVASIMDNEINLPPFTLPERYEESEVYVDKQEQNALYPGLSSTYFLLRQRPEMIAETISIIQIGLKEANAAEPSAKRLKQGS